MKILSIGNSFSQDAHRWLHQLAAANNLDIEAVNLYIGGCGLEKHWTNVVEDNAHYDLEINGESTGKKISIRAALEMDSWDIITLQQVSYLSGMLESYAPYLTCLADMVRKARPEAKLYFHQTWAYETDSTHARFDNYDHDQQKMYECILAACTQAAKSIGADIISVGDVIQKLRNTVPEFNYTGGGHSLCRDGFHLSYDYGRYAAAATWIRALTGKKITPAAFENFDVNLLEKIANAINEY